MQPSVAAFALFYDVAKNNLIKEDLVESVISIKLILNHPNVDNDISKMVNKEINELTDKINIEV